MISSGGSRKVATFCPYWYLLVLYLSAGIGLVQPSALLSSVVAAYRCLQVPSYSDAGQLALERYKDV